MRLTLLFTALLLACGNALDLKPVETTRDLEGFKIPVLEFRDGQRTARWQPPEGWTHSFDTDRLRFSSKTVSGAFFELRVLPISPDEKPPTDASLTDLAKPLFPKSFVDPSFTGTFQNRFMLGVIPTVELTFKAVEFGRPAQGSVFFATLNDKQRLAVLVTGREADFKALHEAVVSSLVGWNWE